MAPTPSKWQFALVATVLALLLCRPAPLPAGPPAAAANPAPSTLNPATTEAFANYLALTDQRNQTELQRGSPFLWIDALPAAQRTAAYTALQHGEVQIQKLATLDRDQPIPCPGGLIHHWTGAIFIPATKLDAVLQILEDYNHHSTYYAPDVERSQIESRNGDHFKVFLRFRRHKVITVVLNTEHDIQYFRDSPTRAHSRSSATRISEVANAGKPDEREKPAGDDDGFMWRMETWWRFAERDGGVYVQSEVVSLTRDIPTGLGWMIGPFINGIPQESLTATLVATRQAVQSK